MSGRVVDERIADRRREVREQDRRRRLRRTLSVLVLLAFLGLLYAIERSPLVQLSEVRVTGAHRLAPAAIGAAADLPLGTSIVRLDLDEAEARVRALPLVRDARARRVDPLTVEIVVEERIPVAVVAASATRVLVDRDGILLVEATEPGLATILLPEGTRLPRLGSPSSELPVLDAALRLYVGMDPATVGPAPRFEARSADEVDLIMDATIRVHLGRADRIDEKSRALAAVLEDVGDTPVSVIDLRAPSNPVVRS